MRGLKGKVALLTGAGRGIGRGISLRLAQEGSHLVLNDLDDQPLQEVAGEARHLGARVATLAGSVTDPTLAERLVGLARQEFGDLHLVVPCAGFTWDGVLHRMTDEQWQAILDVHLTGTFRIFREAMKLMRDRAREEQQAGRTPPSRHMLAISSVSAFGNFGQANYSAAKAGLIGLAKTAAIEGASLNILANAMAFGFIETRMTQERGKGETFQGRALGIPQEIRDQLAQRSMLKRFGTVEEAVGATVFMLSEDSSYITGQVIEVNGGFRY